MALVEYYAQIECDLAMGISLQDALEEVELAWVAKAMGV